MNDSVESGPPVSAGGLDSFPSFRDASSKPVVRRVGVLLFGPGDTARDVFLAWEALRFVYNGILALLAVALAAAFGVVTKPEFWGQAFAGAAFANLCFCVGPCGEGYLAMARVDRRVARGLVFAAGLSFSSLVALVAVATMAIPSF